MKLVRLILLIVVVLGAALVALSPRARLLARHGWFALRATPVEMVLRDAKDGEVVYLDGAVAARLVTPFSDRGQFRLEDRTGSVHVVMTGRPPDEGARTVVRGRVDRDPGPLLALVSGGVVIEAEAVLSRPR